MSIITTAALVIAAAVGHALGLAAARPVWPAEVGWLVYIGVAGISAATLYTVALRLLGARTGSTVRRR